MRASFATVVAASIHSRRKRFGVTEHAGEQGYHERSEHTHAARGAVRQTGAAADLSVVDHGKLAGELRHEAQRDAHDHAELVGSA